MVIRILKGYLSMVGALGRFALLSAVCVGGGLAIVYPLWLLATTRADVYTLVCGLLFAAVAGTLAAGRIRTAYRLNPPRFRRNLLKFLVLAAGLSSSAALVLTWHRVLALAVLFLTAGLWGFLAFAHTAAPSDKV